MPLLVDVLDTRTKKEDNWSSQFLEELYQREIGDKLPLKTASKEDKEEAEEAPVEPEEPVDDGEGDETLLDSDIDTLGVEDDDDVALESYLALEEDGYAMSGGEFAANLATPVTAAGKLLYHGAKKAAVIGATGAVIGYNHVKDNKEFYKDTVSKLGSGIQFIAKKTLSGIFKGSVVLSNFTDKKINNIPKLINKLEKLKVSIGAVEGKPLGEYKRDKIGIFKIGNKNFLYSVEVMSSFLEEINEYTAHSYKGKTLSISKGISKNKSDNVTHDIHMVDEHVQLKSFKEVEKTSSLISYDSKVLPGDVIFRVSVPNTETDDLVAAYKESKLEMLHNLKETDTLTGFPYLDKEDVLKSINDLLLIAKILEQSKHFINDVTKVRNGMMGAIKRNTNLLSDRMQNKYIEESYLLSKERSLYLDRVHTSLILKTEELAFQFLKAGISFIESNVVAFKKDAA